MARRTNTDAIRELEIAAAVLQARADRFDHELERVQSTVGESMKSLSDLGARTLRMEQQLDDLREGRQRLAHYLWMLAGVIIGSVLTIGGNILLEFVRRRL